jgi:hypothetical protein
MLRIDRDNQVGKLLRVGVETDLIGRFLMLSPPKGGFHRGQVKAAFLFLR